VQLRVLYVKGGERSHRRFLFGNARVILRGVCVWMCWCCVCVCVFAFLEQARVYLVLMSRVFFFFFFFFFWICSGLHPRVRDAKA